jgi:hypothetical protein
VQVGADLDPEAIGNDETANHRTAVGSMRGPGIQNGAALLESACFAA